MAGAGGKPPDWQPGARRGFLETLDRILADDPRTAELIRVRAERAFALIQAHPSLGTPTRWENVSTFMGQRLNGAFTIWVLSLIHI